MLHTFDGPCYTKNEKYMKKREFSMYFSFFVWYGPSKVYNLRSPWMRNQIFHPMSVFSQNLSKPIGR